ncbi:hypothetical protein VNO77_23877 [Canavalia gladiata]|uniref:Uncharacterized protein n=1 Tax=Canavalia gladiata TaxID=3824 RepID=A0AAN9QC36_CANGL
MDWWHKITTTWTAFSTRIKLRKSRVSGGRRGGAGVADCGGPDSGLLKLRDDVQMCGYRDVEVMWNILSIGLQPEQMETTRSSNNGKLHKRAGLKNRSFSRVLFWINHSP